jgi:hypothetical protein
MAMQTANLTYRVRLYFAIMSEPLTVAQATLGMFHKVKPDSRKPMYESILERNNMASIKRHYAWTNVALFENDADCRTMEEFLKEEGFEARTYNDRLLQLLLFLCPPRLTYRLQVRADELKVVQHLTETSPPVLMAKAVHCPVCKSLEVDYPQMTRQFFVPTLLLHLGIIFRIIEHECFCEHCHCIWNLPKKNAPSPRIVRAAKVFPFNRGE